MITFEHIIKDPVGLHAKPARKLVEVAKRLDSRITICANNKTADATKLIRIISMGLVSGTKIIVTIEGGNEESSLKTLKCFFSGQV